MADEKKAEDKKKAAEKKVLDENDDAFCGYVSIQTLDQDGIAGRIMGSHVKAPVQIVSEPGADTVLFEAVFLGANPLFYLELRNEEQFFVWGQWWMDGPKHSESNQICTLVPIKMQECHKQMDAKPNEFSAKAQCEFLRSSTTRLMDVGFTTETKKFKTKLTKVTMAMPRQAWMEYKQYRVRLWKAGNNWKGMEKDEDEKEKKDGEKDGEKEGEKKETADRGQPLDQFEANKRNVSVSSTFNEELYTTKLDESTIPKDKRDEADRIAREIEQGQMASEEEVKVEGQDDDEEADASMRSKKGMISEMKRIKR